MGKSKDNVNGIVKIIKRIQELFPEVNLGEYVEHFICEDNTYKVVLNNNTTIKIHRATAQDAELNIASIEDGSLKTDSRFIRKYIIDNIWDYSIKKKAA